MKAGESYILENLRLRAQERRRIERALETWVKHSRKTGHTWSEIATALGVTRQAAWSKYGHVEKEKTQ